MSNYNPSASFTFNALGQIKAVTDASGTRAIDYAADGQMITEALAFNTSLFTLHEKYDSVGRNQGYALSNDVAQITGNMQAFDQYGRLNQVAVDGIPNAFTYGYLEGSHLQKTLAMPNGVTRTFGYEPNRDLLTMIVHSNATDRLVQRDFTFDGFGRLSNRTLFRVNEIPVNPDAFGYNARSELTNAVMGANAFAYNFDPIGNRTAATEFGTNTSYIANALNQYTQLDLLPPTSSFLPQHDADGNQTLLKTTTGIWHVTYNAENRPILFSNDTTKVEMAYDYMGRRFEYKEAISGTLNHHERYLYRGYLQLAALDMLNSSSLKHVIVWDESEPVAARPLALQIGTNTYFYSLDQVKNVTELFDSSGALVVTYDYSPFGHLAASTGVIVNPLTFSSEINDTTLGLQYYNYRHLNTLDGRWVNRDPIGERGGWNVYSFANNNSIRTLDLFGLTTKKIKEKKCNKDTVGETRGDVIDTLFVPGEKGPDGNRDLLTIMAGFALFSELLITTDYEGTFQDLLIRLIRSGVGDKGGYDVTEQMLKTLSNFNDLLYLHRYRVTVWMKVQCQVCLCTDWFTDWPFNRPKINFDWENYGDEKWVKCDITKTEWYKKERNAQGSNLYLLKDGVLDFRFLKKDMKEKIIKDCRKQADKACEE